MSSSLSISAIGWVPPFVQVARDTLDISSIPEDTRNFVQMARDTLDTTSIPEDTRWLILENTSKYIAILAKYHDDVYRYGTSTRKDAMYLESNDDLDVSHRLVLLCIVVYFAVFHVLSTSLYTCIQQGCPVTTNLAVSCLTLPLTLTVIWYYAS